MLFWIECRCGNCAIVVFVKLFRVFPFMYATEHHAFNFSNTDMHIYRKKITCHSLCWVEDHRIWSWWTCPTFNHRVDLTLSSPFEIPGSRQHFSRMCKIRFGTRRFEKLLILLRSVYYFHFNLKAEEARLFAEYSGYRKFPASWKPTQILSSARELVASDLLLRWTTLATWPHLHWSIRYACCIELCFRL